MTMWRTFKEPAKLLNLLESTSGRHRKILQCSCYSSDRSSKKVGVGGFRGGKLFVNNFGVLGGHGQFVRRFSEMPEGLGQTADQRLQGINTVLVDNPVIEFFQNKLIELHSTIGLPWWATIVLVSCTARCLLTLPSAFYQQHILAKTSNLNWEMQEIAEELKADANYRVQVLGYSETESGVMYSKAMREKWHELIVRENCHPMKGFVLLLTQLPLWIGLSCAIRNLCFALPHPTPLAYKTCYELSTEGVAWFSNLIIADPYYILPITMGVCHLMNIEFNYMMRTKEVSKPQKIMLYVFRGVTFILVPIAAYIPTGMSLYWTTSSVFSVFQNLVIVSPKIRRFVRIEESEREMAHPYKHVWGRLKERLPRRLMEASALKETPKKAPTKSVVKVK